MDLGPRPLYSCAHGQEAAPDPVSRRAARILRGRGPRRADRGTRAAEMGRARLCAPRDRAQPLRRGGLARQGRGLCRGTGRGARRPSRDLFRPRCAEIGPGRGAASRDGLRGRHLPPGQQGPYRGRAAPCRGPADGHDRPCRPPRGAGHDGPVAGRRGHPGRDGRGRGAGHAARPAAAGLDHADHPVGGRHRADRGRPTSAVSRHRGPRQGRHLLCHDEPAGCRQGHRAQDRRAAGDRGAEQLEFEAAGRSRPLGRLRLRAARDAGRRHRLARAGRHPRRRRDGGGKRPRSAGGRGDRRLRGPL